MKDLEEEFPFPVLHYRCRLVVDVVATDFAAAVAAAGGVEAGIEVAAAARFQLGSTSVCDSCLRSPDLLGKRRRRSDLKCPCCLSSSV